MKISCVDENTKKVKIRAKTTGEEKVYTEGKTFVRKDSKERNNIPQKMAVKEEKSPGAGEVRHVMVK